MGFLEPPEPRPGSQDTRPWRARLDGCGRAASLGLTLCVGAQCASQIPSWKMGWFPHMLGSPLVESPCCFGGTAAERTALAQSWPLPRLFYMK